MGKYYPAFTSESLVEYGVYLGALTPDTTAEALVGMLPTERTNCPPLPGSKVTDFHHKSLTHATFPVVPSQQASDEFAAHEPAFCFLRPITTTVTRPSLQRTRNLFIEVNHNTTSPHLVIGFGKDSSFLVVTHLVSFIPLTA